MWASLNTFSAASGDFTKAAEINSPPTTYNTTQSKNDGDLRKLLHFLFSSHTTENLKLPNKTGGIFLYLLSTDSLRICQTGEGISFCSPLHGIILAISENAKNGRKKTGNLF